MSGYDEAVAWFRADPERVRDLDDVDNRSAAIAIVNAVLAGSVPAGRDLTANDVIDVMQAWRTGRVNVAVATDELNRIARPSGGVGQPDTTVPRSWSLPAPPPDDVTVVYVDAAPNHLLYRADRSGTVWESKRLGKFFRWSQMLSEGTVVEGEPPASEPPFAVGDRVRVKSTGRTGVLREIDSRGRHLIFGDNESWITGVRADNLEPAPEPPRFERGFYRLARDLDTEHGVIRERLVFAAHLDTVDEVWRVFCESGDAWVSAAALATAGAVRVEGDR